MSHHGLGRRRDDAQFRLYLDGLFYEEVRRLVRWMTSVVRGGQDFRCCKGRYWRGVLVELRVVQVGVLGGRGVVFGDLGGVILGDADFDGVAELGEVLLRELEVLELVEEVVVLLMVVVQLMLVEVVAVVLVLVLVLG